MNTRQASKRKQSIAAEFDPKRPCFSTILDNYQMVHVLVLHMLPYLSIWAVERLTIVSKTFRAVINELHREIAYWCGPLSSWLNYVTDTVASASVIVKPKGPFHRVALVDAFTAKYYATALVLCTVKDGLLNWIDQLLNLLFLDDNPVDDIFKAVISKIIHVFRQESKESKLKEAIFNVFIESNMSTTGRFNAKCRYIISQTVIINADIIDNCLTNLQLYYYCLDYSQTNEGVWNLIVLGEKTILHVLAMYEYRQFRLMPMIDTLLRLDWYESIKKDISLLDQLLSKLGDEVSEFISWMCRVHDNACVLFNRMDVMQILKKYVSLETLSGIFPVIRREAVHYECEYIALAQNDTEYIDILYENKTYFDKFTEDQKWKHTREAFRKVKTIDMFIRVWKQYTPDVNVFLRQFPVMCILYSEALLIQVLKFINAPSLSPYYDSTYQYITPFSFDMILLKYEIQTGCVSREAIEYYGCTYKFDTMLLASDPEMALFMYLHEYYDSYKYALDVYKPGMKYTFTNCEFRIATEYVIQNVLNANRVTAEAVRRVIRGMSYDTQWEKTMEALIAKHPIFLKKLKCEKCTSPGVKSFIMKHLHSDTERAAYLQKCQYEDMCSDEYIEIYRLSIQYRLPLDDKCKAKFYN